MAHAGTGPALHDVGSGQVWDPETGAITSGTDSGLFDTPAIEIPDFEFLDPEQLADLQGLSDTVIGQFESILDPDYSVVSPELMDALQRQIGGIFQTSMDKNTAAANLGGFSPASGVTGQANLYAGSQAANALGNLMGTSSVATEQAQQWAASQLESLREFDINTVAGQYGLGAALQSGMAGLTAPGVLAGPTLDVTDPMALWNSIFGQTQLGEQMQAALDSGQISNTDLMTFLGPLLELFS